MAGRPGLMKSNFNRIRKEFDNQKGYSMTTIDCPGLCLKRIAVYFYLLWQESPD
jgi:hypothetical protein